MEFPLRLGELGDFARVRTQLERFRFDEPTICRALGIANVAQIGQVATEGLDLDAACPTPALALLARAFVFTEPVLRQDATHCLGAAALASLVALDLLRPGPDEMYVATAQLYPVAGVVIASDRRVAPDGAPLDSPDVVFPACDAGTVRFLGIIPRSAARDALDLCAGTGVAALVLSPHVHTVVAADVTPRSAHFATFNALLNGRANVEIAVGDLYDAVRGRTFDRIVAHPPYVPGTDQAHVYRDGGATGETLLHRIVSELPRYLRPGGTLYCVAAGWDAVEGPFETRLRRWLGAAEREFDVIFAQQEDVPPEYLARWLAEKDAPDDPDARARHERRFREAGLERNVYGAIVLRRAGASGRPPLTARPRLSPRTDGACFEWALRWHAWRGEQEARGGLTAALLGSHPRLGPRLRAQATYAPRDGGVAIAEVSLQSDRPFRAATRVEPWMLDLLQCFGRGRTALEACEEGRARGSVPAGFGADDLTTLLAMMVERGYLELAEVS